MKFRVSISILLLLVPAAAAAQSPAEVERRILSTLQTISESGTYGGTYGEDDGARNSNANKELSGILLQQGKRADVLAFVFPKLKDKMAVATSSDGKLRIYSWDTETGGTMHDYSSVVQYQGSSGKVYTWAYDPPDSDDASVPAGIGSDGYYLRILQVDTSKGPIYLAISLSIGCGQCHGQSVEAARIQGESLDRAAKVIKTRSGLTNLLDFAYAPATIPGDLKAENWYVSTGMEGRSVFRSSLTMTSRAWAGLRGGRSRTGSTEQASFGSTNAAQRTIFIRQKMGIDRRLFAGGSRRGSDLCNRHDLDGR